jgi:hypothetical protein
MQEDLRGTGYSWRAQPSDTIGARHAALDQRVNIADVLHVRVAHPLVLVERNPDYLVDPPAEAAIEQRDLSADRTDFVIARALPLQLLDLPGLGITRVHGHPRSRRARERIRPEAASTHTVEWNAGDLRDLLQSLKVLVHPPGLPACIGKNGGVEMLLALAGHEQER